MQWRNSIFWVRNIRVSALLQVEWRGPPRHTCSIVWTRECSDAEHLHFPHFSKQTQHIQLSSANASVFGQVRFWKSWCFQFFLWDTELKKCRLYFEKRFEYTVLSISEAQVCLVFKIFYLLRFTTLSPRLSPQCAQSCTYFYSTELREKYFSLPTLT